jgi:hypothetical protein
VTVSYDSTANNSQGDFGTILPPIADPAPVAA